MAPSNSMTLIGKARRPPQQGKMQCAPGDLSDLEWCVTFSSSRGGHRVQILLHTAPLRSSGNRGSSETLEVATADFNPSWADTQDGTVKYNCSKIFGSSVGSTSVGHCLCTRGRLRLTLAGSRYRSGLSADRLNVEQP